MGGGRYGCCRIWWLYDLNWRHLQVDIIEYELIMKLFLCSQDFHIEVSIMVFNCMENICTRRFMTKECPRDQELVQLQVFCSDVFSLRGLSVHMSKIDTKLGDTCIFFPSPYIIAS